MNSAVLPNKEHNSIVAVEDVSSLGTGRRSAPSAAAAAATAAGSGCSIGVVSASGSEKRRGRFCSHGRPPSAVSPTTTTTTTRPKRRMTRPKASRRCGSWTGEDWIDSVVGRSRNKRR